MNTGLWNMDFGFAAALRPGMAAGEMLPDHGAAPAWGQAAASEIPSASRSGAMRFDSTPTLLRLRTSP
jgi:hypothetical protein